MVCELRSMLPIPNKDKLRLTTVCIGGDRTEEVVTNVVSMVPTRKYLVAIADCTLPGGMEIKRCKVGGVESAGMFCGPKELGWPKDDVLSSKEPVMVPARLGLDAGSSAPSYEAVKEAIETEAAEAKAKADAAAARK